MNEKDLYLVFEIMETDLHIVIKGKLLKTLHKQYIIYQLLKSLKYLHSADIVHRDLKPSNMLINSDCLMKLADFGLARSISEKNGDFSVMSEYIATRWYRAPEILFGSHEYSKPIDMWSVGCILAEILSDKVLFTGKSTLNQIEIIIELLGLPSENDLMKMNSDIAWSIMKNIKTKKKKSFTKVFSFCSPEAIDLMKKLLVYNPDKRYIINAVRYTVEKALAHPFFKNFSDPCNEITCDKVIKISISDSHKMSIKSTVTYYV
jgi:mitogen-activated protein kinase 15